MDAASLSPVPIGPDEAADFVLTAPAGVVMSLAGIDPASLRTLVDDTESGPGQRRVLFLPLAPASTPDELVDQILGRLAETAGRLWPVWFTDASFAACRDDTLGRLAAAAIVHRTADDVNGLIRPWAEAAVWRMLAGQAPRVKGTPAATELVQLALAISRTGLVLAVDARPATARPDTFVRVLEWLAQTSRMPVVAVFPELPPSTPPFDRILYAAREVVNVGQTVDPDTVDVTIADTDPWLAPVRGRPHPLSDIEQRLAAMLDADGELAALFSFNHSIVTVRGSRYRVDLAWADGRLVVELDGPDHAARRKFIDDRHRDYELTLSGFTVLRLANDEIVQDYGRAVEKIRDVVRWRRSHLGMEE